MKDERKRILWLVSWYPNQYDPFDGDFIQRHARAAALYDDLLVLFVRQEEVQKEVACVQLTEAGLTERRIYLPKRKGLLGKIQNYSRWLRVYKEQVKEVMQSFQPQVVHVHIPWKAGLVALWLKKKYGVSFVVTEHWGIYNKVAEDNIHARTFVFRYFLKKIYKEAKVFASVSRFLGEGVNRTLVQKDFTVIPNVVDTSLFFYTGKRNKCFTFLHVSNMVPLKNVEGILRAFHQLLQQTDLDVQLVLVGNRNDQYLHLAQEFGLLKNNTVFFKGEIPYSEVAKEMQQSHALIINSNIENSPCVIGEALCSGLPVIATRVGGIPELLSPSTGILIPPGNDKALLEAMLKMVQQYDQFHREEIAVAAQQLFGYASIGAQLHQLYQMEH